MSRRWMRWGLIASLTVNVLVVAAVLGAALFGGADRHGKRGGGPPHVAALMRGLDGDARRELFGTLRSDAALRSGRDRARDARDAMVAALRTEPFERAAFDAAMATLQETQAALAARGAEMLGDIIADMPPDARRALADRVVEAGRRPR